MIEIPQIEERDIYLSEDVSQVSLLSITQRIIKINKSDKQLKKISKVYGFKYKPKPIRFFIDSYGGDVYTTMGLVGVIEQSKTPVYTIATGAQMSCGFTLLIAGHKRFAYKYATLMYHQISTGFWGTLKDMQESKKETKRIQDWWEGYVLSKTNISKKQLKKVFNKKEDLYLTPLQALELGVIDEVIKSA